MMIFNVSVLSGRPQQISQRNNDACETTTKRLDQVKIGDRQTLAEECSQR